MLQIPSKKRTFTAACFLVGRIGRAIGFDANRPCFIIGTGRCGTTLLVKILQTHPDLSVFPGEANEMWHPALEPFETTPLDSPPIEDDPRRFTEVSIANWPNGHEDRIRDVFTGFHLITGQSKVILTKSAMISFMIPKILDIFPDARFLHIYRYGPSVLESYFKKNFGKYSRHIYTERDYRLCCAKYWNACIMEIEKRKDEFSLEAKGRLIEFSYEGLCKNPTDVLNAITAFLGVKSKGFSFDLSRVASQNYKVGDYTTNKWSTDILDLMSQGMKLKNYNVQLPFDFKHD